MKRGLVMKTRLTTQVGFAALALAFAAATPALAMGKKSGHHAMHHQGGHGSSSASAADHSADQLNAQSLSSIQQGQGYTPSGSAPQTAPMGRSGSDSSM
jgi:Spy/CpxP family protein refolding chaperone